MLTAIELQTYQKLTIDDDNTHLVSNIDEYTVHMYVYSYIKYHRIGAVYVV